MLSQQPVTRATGIFAQLPTHRQTRKDHAAVKRIAKRGTGSAILRTNMSLPSGPPPKPPGVKGGFPASVEIVQTI
jgi:hypothetical protein